MAAIVVAKNPPRFACDKCMCEIGIGPEPRKVVLVASDSELLRQVSPDDDPVKFNLKCNCTCHDGWRIATGNLNTRMRKQGAAYRARVEAQRALERAAEQDRADGRAARAEKAAATAAIEAEPAEDPW